MNFYEINDRRCCILSWTPCKLKTAILIWVVFYSKASSHRYCIYLFTFIFIYLHYCEFRYNEHVAMENISYFTQIYYCTRPQCYFMRPIISKCIVVYSCQYIEHQTMHYLYNDMRFSCYKLSLIHYTCTKGDHQAKKQQQVTLCFGTFV